MLSTPLTVFKPALSHRLPNAAHALTLKQMFEAVSFIQVEQLLCHLSWWRNMWRDKHQGELSWSLFVCEFLLQLMWILSNSSLKCTLAFPTMLCMLWNAFEVAHRECGCESARASVSIHPCRPVLSAGSQLLTCPCPGTVCFLYLCATVCVQKRRLLMRTVCTWAKGSRLGCLLAPASKPWVAPWPTTHPIHHRDKWY